MTPDQTVIFVEAFSRRAISMGWTQGTQQITKFTSKSGTVMDLIKCYGQIDETTLTWLGNPIGIPEIPAEFRIPVVFFSLFFRFFPIPFSEKKVPAFFYFFLLDGTDSRHKISGFFRRKVPEFRTRKRNSGFRPS